MGSGDILGSSWLLFCSSLSLSNHAGLASRCASRVSSLMTSPADMSVAELCAAPNPLRPNAVTHCVHADAEISCAETLLFWP